MISFEAAITYRDIYLTKLRGAKPIGDATKVSISRTHCAIEAEIEWNDRAYLLMTPFHEERVRHIEELQANAKAEGCGQLIENQILYDEMLLTNSTGDQVYASVILQDITNGTPLTQAVNIFKSEELRRAVEVMKQRLDAIGFDHKNLRPANILIYNNGTARPLRYWYAEWVDVAENNIDTALAYINEHEGLGVKSFDLEELEDEIVEREYEGIRRVCHRNKYGYIDSDGQMVAPCIYTYAGHFSEGRAIVCKGNKMGAINNEGEIVVPIVYKSLRFDTSTGNFYAQDEEYLCTLNYQGEMLRRQKFEGGGFLIAESGNQK